MSNKWIADYIDRGDFTGLFVEELGWDRPKGGGRNITVNTDDGELPVSEVATFHGISIWTCPQVPGSRIQRQVDRQLRSESTERVVIFGDADHQVWRWPQSKDSSGAGSSRLVAHEHWIGKDNEALRQRLQLISIGLDEEISVLELSRRLRKAFDSDKVTKSFYAKFSAQHVVAACLLRGRFNLPDLLPEALASPAVRDLALRVKCEADPDSAFPEFFSGGVEVTLRDGRVLSRHVRVNSGAGARAMGADQVRAKFMASASLAIDAGKAEQIADAVLDLEKTGARDLMALFRSG